MRNLFRDMPVRRNILNNKKRINQEIKALELLLKTYAICHPTIRFKFTVNSNIIFAKSTCKHISEALRSVLGMQLFSKLTYIKKSFSNVSYIVNFLYYILMLCRIDLLTNRLKHVYFLE